MNRKEEKFDWDNDNLTEIKMDDKEPKLVQPDFIAEIPGIEVESNYEPIIGPKPNTEPEVKSSYVERTKNAHKIAGRNTDVVKQSKARGVDDYEDDASDIEIEESDDESDGGVYPGIKQEAIKFEDVPENDDEDNPPSLAKRGSVPPMASRGRGKRVRVPKQMLIPTMKGKDYDEGVYEGVGFTHIKSISVECKMYRIKNQFAGAGYSTKRELIKLQFDDNAPPPPKMTEAHTDAHNLGAILVQKYGLKNRIKLFR